MTYKTIFSGRLEFGSSRNFEQVLRMFYLRLENFYKNEIALSVEDIFNEEEHCLNIPREVTYCTDKICRNTVNLLEYIAQYAIAGSLSVWVTDSGMVQKHHLIEPKGDKVAVQSFLKGREMTKEEGKEDEAHKALSKAIEKFERHALAYERRGYVNYLLGNKEDAIYDFTKSIDINPHNADPYMGRALVRMSQNELKSAIADLEKAIKNSIPLQPIYWKARLLKGECHLKLSETDKAVFELKLFTRRQFSSENPNYPLRRRAFFDYGRALLSEGKYTEAVKAFDQSLQIKGEADEDQEVEELLFRGIAMQKAGQTGYEKDWEKAAKRGSKRAAELLQAMG